MKVSVWASDPAGSRDSNYLTMTQPLSISGFCLPLGWLHSPAGSLYGMTRLMPAAPGSVPPTQEAPVQSVFPLDLTKVLGQALIDPLWVTCPSQGQSAGQRG